MLADVNFNLIRFWTLIVVLIGAPLLAFLLMRQQLLSLPPAESLERIDQCVIEGQRPEAVA